ncbi:UPF0262 family protein [Rhizobium etli]|uniref:UPF0262 family protein n=1 Tax=Rhizobium etli TaxID=29449 RepID=UPI0003839813|nr:UPF0262 family protein [Rhizobium etli]AGS24527.1 hypothetical protein REMIM1_PC00174 [Rhizobium etli bv. mimosae str. Mim1]
MACVSKKHVVDATNKSGDAAEYRLCDVSLEQFPGDRDARLEREQAIAIVDLLENNMFAPLQHGGGPYRLGIAMAGARLALHITTDQGAHVLSHFLSLAPFRRLLKDYSHICENYYNALAWPGPDRLEAIDMSRRAIHDEAAELLKERLSSKVTVDHDTARRLFTLIFILLVRGAPHCVVSNQ